MIKEITLLNSKFLVDNINGCNFVFSTAENNLSLSLRNIKAYEGALKEYFNFKNLGYAKQIHSDIVLNYDEAVEEGDAVIASLEDTALGVFTADCVPVLIADAKKRVVAAVHSGWKGTYANIVGKTLQRLIDEYGCHVKDIMVYIGPHIRSCCYEVGPQLKDRFLQKGFREEDFIDTKLSLESCIVHEALEGGVLQENLHAVDYCTKCSDAIPLHSYRRDGEESGRNFSFVFLS